MMSIGTFLMMKTRMTAEMKNEFLGFSLFSGIGGADLAFEWAGGTVVGMCEIDPFCQKVLNKHWPLIPVFNDIKELSLEEIKGVVGNARINCLYGGFPC